MKTLVVLSLSTLCGLALADPAPTLDADQALLAGPKCKTFSAAVQREAGSVTPQPGTPPAVLVAKMMEAVKASTPPAEWKLCSVAFDRGMEAYRFKAMEAEATLEFDRIGKGLAAYLAEQGKLCASTKHPAPIMLALVSKGPYSATAADWADPAWTCAGVGNDLKSQHFQYEMKTTPTTVTLIARGYPVPTKLVTLTKSARVKDGTLVWSGTVRKDAK